MDKQTCNGKVEKMEENSSTCAVERGGTADTVVTGVGEAAVDEGTSHCQVGQTEWYTAAWSFCRLRPKHTPSCMIVLVLSSQKMSKVENGSSSGLGLLKRPPWFMLSPEAMFISVMCVTARGLSGVCGLCSHPGLINAKVLVDAYGLCCSQGSC